jgi:hypothetical protein
MHATCSQVIGRMFRATEKLLLSRFARFFFLSLFSLCSSSCAIIHSTRIDMYFLTFLAC